MEAFRTVSVLSTAVARNPSVMVVHREVVHVGEWG